MADGDWRQGGPVGGVHSSGEVSPDPGHSTVLERRDWVGRGEAVEWAAGGGERKCWRREGGALG